MAEVKLLEQVRNAVRVRHYSRRTEKAYVGWVRRFVLYHDKRHPFTLAEPDVGAFLTYLARKERVSAATQNQALNALVFLYRYVLDRPLEEIGEEVRAVLESLTGTHRLVASLLYGPGLGTFWVGPLYFITG